MIWATVSSQSCFCWLYRASPSLAAKNQSDFGVDHLVMSMCRVFSCVVGIGCLLWSVHSLGTTLLAFALLHSVLQGQISLLVKGMVFPVVMYGCESWTIKKAECRRIDAFELWCWKRLLRVPWTAKRSNQSILKEISPGYSLEGLILKLKLPILWPPDVKTWFIWKGTDAGKDWGQEEKGTTEDEMIVWHHWLNAHGFGWTPRVGGGQGGLACCSSWDRKESDMTEWLNWTELNSQLTQNCINVS